jgi:hypothetical protein
LENLDKYDDNFKVNFQNVVTQVAPIYFTLERGGSGIGE